MFLRFFIICIIVSLFLACQQKQTRSIPDKITAQDRQRYLEGNLNGVAKKLAKYIGKRSVAFAGIFRHNIQKEPGVSKYVTPYIIGKLADMGVKVLQRQDLKQLFKERMATVPENMKESDFESITKIAKADVLIIAKLKDFDVDTYSVSMNIIEVKSSKIITTLHWRIDRRNLPVKYGGT